MHWLDDVTSRRVASEQEAVATERERKRATGEALGPFVAMKPVIRQRLLELGEAYRGPGRGFWISEDDWRLQLRLSNPTAQRGPILSDAWEGFSLEFHPVGSPKWRWIFGRLWTFKRKNPTVSVTCRNPKRRNLHDDSYLNIESGNMTEPELKRILREAALAGALGHEGY